MLQSFSRRTAALLLTTALALTFTLLPESPARAADPVTQGITGTVTGPDGQPRAAHLAIQPVDPSVKLDDGDGIYFVGCEAFCATWTNYAGGRFDIPLPVGEYRVQIYTTPTQAEQLAAEYWQDSASPLGSSVVTVTEGALTTIDPVLGPASSISGTVPSAAGTDGRGYVEAWVPDLGGGYHRVSADSTDADGRYELTGLTPGSYLVHARIRPHWTDENSGSEGWYGGAKSAATATPVVVPDEGVDVPTGDLILSPFAKIRGTITSPAIGPVPDAHLRFLVKEVGGGLGGWTVRYEADTAADGTYSVPAEAGTYRVEVVAAAHLTAGLGGGPFLTAPSFTHEQTQAGPDIDVQLTPSRAIPVTGARISGSPTVDRVLTVSTGTWYPAGLTYSYQWKRDGSPITGATGTTYRVRPADVGHDVRVTVTAAKTGVPAGTSTTSTGPVRKAWFVLSGIARLTGTLRVGSTLRAIAPKPVPGGTVRFEWLRSWDRIKGVTGSTYRLRRADRGHWMAVRITISRPGYTTIVRERSRTLLVR